MIALNLIREMELNLGYTVVVENDISQWQDSTGVRYHFPKRYANALKPGTRLIHYKGKLKDRSFRNIRLSDDPHYFATSIAGATVTDPNSTKGDLFVEIEHFHTFDRPAIAKISEGVFFEDIPPSQQKNFWRNGVRSTTQSIFYRILAAAGAAAPDEFPIQDVEVSPFISVLIEGGEKRVYSTLYERRPELRRQAVALHGTTCFACEISLESVYGEIARGHIHIHHRRPLSITGETLVDPRVDLLPVCPTCHAIIHLGGKLRTINDVRMLLGKPAIALGN